ncbi:Serine_palmitoyltransferase 1 [Hexamita inflata]|uniref:Serine palmitoyltransferase 1 n=1 Tax=Hexamita inflata TaxID=28002 RepID=A0AA86PUR9_9EUKA|nr:Serine palmitoyltransferase 1 [Hexamita inflata]
MSIFSVFGQYFIFWDNFWRGIYIYSQKQLQMNFMIKLNFKSSNLTSSGAMTLMNEKGFLQLGKTKRGTAEHLNDKAGKEVISNRDIDLITTSFEDTFGIPGGACSGAMLLIGNMRTAALGYCYSASQSPSLVAVIRWMMREILCKK